MGRVSKDGTMINVEKVRRWLDSHSIGSACPLCKGEDLRIGRHLYQLVPTPAPFRLTALDRHSGVVRVRCGTCSHLMLFHARSMGIDADDVLKAAHARSRQRPRPKA